MPQTLSHDQVRHLVGQGIRAPSGGNCQPWRFEFTADARLRCFYDAARAENFLDYDYLATHLAMGGAVENIVLAAAAMGLYCKVELMPPSDDGIICELLFRADQPPATEASLADQIRRRATNRRLGRRTTLPDEAVSALTMAAEAHDASLQLITDAPTLQDLGDVIGACDRFRFWNQHLHRELMEEVRWTAEEAERTQDGVDVRTLDIGSFQVAALKILASWNAVSVLRSLNIRQPFEAMSSEAIRHSSAVGLITVDGTSRPDYFRGGRAFERVWLAATQLNLGLQPLAVAPYLFARLLRGSGLTAPQRAELQQIRERFCRLVPTHDERAEVMMFRLIVADPPSTRSLRRSVDDVLELKTDR